MSSVRRRLARNRRNVFLSYRREDTSGYAGRLYDSLVDRFGKRGVFMDIDTIPPGEDFRKAIEDAVGACDALVALIGRRWSAASADGSARRLDDLDDWVRLELEYALEHGIAVIPALVDGARPPAADELPDSLRPLAGRQAIELSNQRWSTDFERLAAAVASIDDSAQRRKAGSDRSGRRLSKRGMAIGGGVLIALAAGALAALLLLSTSPPCRPTATADTIQVCGEPTSLEPVFHTAARYAGNYSAGEIDAKIFQGLTTAVGGVPRPGLAISLDAEAYRLELPVAPRRQVRRRFAAHGSTGLWELVAVEAPRTDRHHGRPSRPSESSRT